MSAPLVGIYPGTFDPITNGHLDIVLRSARLCDTLIMAIARNPGKNPLFSVCERVDMAKEALAAAGDKAANVKVQCFDNLLMNFVQEQKARLVIRGLRAVTDFEYEYQMAAINRRMDKHVETIFLTASDDCHFISSRFIRDISWHGGDVSQFVPSCVVPHIEKRIAERREKSKTV